MLATFKIKGFIPTKDRKRARAFYMDILGLECISEDQFALELRGGANRIRIVDTENFAPLPSTIFGWEVPNIEQTVSGLKERGICFEVYEWMKQDKLGIWESPTQVRSLV
ncbi:MAG: VOC family protein [Proteobacteria bacterium]|nr:VOC family protein [Pseudomonadota bacterium]